MLGKDDTFKVVLNPGTDKVEKQCLGPAPALGWDTGWGKPATAQPFVNRVAERLYSIGGLQARQFPVPLCEGLGRRDANARCSRHAVELRQVLQPIDFHTSARAKHRPANQEK